MVYPDFSQGFISKIPQRMRLADVPERKSALRSRIRESRKKITPELKGRRDSKLSERTVALISALPHSRVAAFVPMPSEPGGDFFLPAVACACKELWLPVCYPKGQLRWGQYTGPESLRPGKFGILEPITPTADSATLSTLDAVFVPALAIDEAGFRLGQGAGYYDRAMADFSGLLVAVVYAHEVLPVGEVPTQQHDIKCSAIITDEGTIWVGE